MTSFKAKKVHINGLNFWRNSKSAIFWVYSGFSPDKVFPKKLSCFLSFSFLPFRHIVSHCQTASPIFLIFYRLDQSGVDFRQKFNQKWKNENFKSIEIDINNLCSKQQLTQRSSFALFSELSYSLILFKWFFIDLFLQRLNLTIV